MAARSLMSGARRYLAAAVLALLLVPSVGMVVAPYETQSAAEHRALALPPNLPRDGRGWALLPRRIDGWFADHFAWRGYLVQANLKLQAAAGFKRGGDQVLRGKDDWLFLYAGLLAQTGGDVRPAVAKRYAEFVCQLQDEARAHGARFLFAPAPGTAEIYPEALPDWTPRGSPTQPDLVLQDARACGVQPLDLRPAMRAAKSGGEKLYLHHDSHWTNAGALIAFNSMAAALGQPWTIDAKSLDWRPGRPMDSDLIRLSGDLSLPQELAPEPPEGADNAPGEGQLKDLAVSPYPAPFVVPGAHPRPMVLVIGDSYTADFMRQYFRRAGVTWAWSHAAECRFNRGILDRVKPDFVVLMPVSRLESCR